MNALLIAANSIWSTFPAVITLSVFNTLIMFFAAHKFMQTLQQTGYDGRGYLQWLKRRDNIYMLRLIIVSILSVLAYLVFNIAIMIFTDSERATYFGFAFYVVFCIVYIERDRKMKSKVPLVHTARMNRLNITFIILSFFLDVLLLTIANLLSIGIPSTALLVRLRYGILCLSPVMLPFVLILAFYINQPIENNNKKKYIKKCKNTLKDRPDLIKIGITGSYGKTTVKEILNTILSEKYSVLGTPHSFNTPMGICKTVKRLKDSNQIFIAEMGARNVGDIKELADMVKPQYAIINGITGQHLETFGNIGAIKQTKYELIEGLAENGFAVFSGDNDITLELYDKCPVRKMTAGLKEGCDVYADEIEISDSGTKFTLHINGKSARCSTVLLGRHNVTNICLAAAVAADIGMSLEEIAAGINAVKPIPHRLQLLQGKNGAVIIDDSFNANVDGTKAAMEVLDHFEGRKIAVTPGLVELGKTEDYENFKFGQRLAEHVDKVILVGKRRIERIYDGLMDAGFNSEDITSVSDLSAAEEVLAQTLCKGDIVIFENDLPDKYN